MTIQIRRDTAANWTSNNPTLAAGEIGYESDTVRIKVGDGSTAWTSLGYAFESVNLVGDLTPQLGGMLDVNGQAFGDGTLELLDFSETGSAVNHIRITNAITTAAPSVSAVGDDTNINLNLAGKGTGVVTAGGVAVVTTTGTQTLTNKTLTTPTLTTPTIATSFIFDSVTVTGLTGSDVTVCTGTAGTASDLAIWNADGDLVDGPTPPSGTIVGTTDTQTLTNKTLTDPKVSHSYNAQTGTTYTLVLTDANKVVSMSNASANTLTIPPNSSVAFPTGTIITIFALGAGTTTIAGGTGVTLSGNGGSGSAYSADIQTQYNAATIIKIGTDSWLISGDIDAVAA